MRNYRAKQRTTTGLCENALLDHWIAKQLNQNHGARDDFRETLP